jgi:hypothetical protein
VQFDEEPALPRCSTKAAEAGSAPAKPFSGALCLRITRRSDSARAIAGWNYRLWKSHPRRMSFRYLRLGWRATGDGVMLELRQRPMAQTHEAADVISQAGTRPVAGRAKSRDRPRRVARKTCDLCMTAARSSSPALRPTALAHRLLRPPGVDAGASLTRAITASEPGTRNSELHYLPQAAEPLLIGCRVFGFTTA